MRSDNGCRDGQCRRRAGDRDAFGRVYFRDELPKTNVGKILRRELKDQLKK